METEKPQLKVRLKAGEEKRILGGHPWVFSNEIESVEGAPKPGDLAEVVARGDRRLGLAFYNPLSLIACRMITREAGTVDAAFFRARIEIALGYRERLRPGGTFYRLCFSEADGLPGLLIDRYGDYFILQILSAGMERRLSLVQEALEGLFSPKGIFLKNDHRMRGLEGLKSECRALCGTVPERIEVPEAGLRFVTPLGEGQKTGFYFDQTENRAFMRPYFVGRSVLDLHCYTGAFALQAVKYGAKAAIGIDSSAPAVSLAQENAELNGLSQMVRFEAGDAEEVLASILEGRTDFKPDMICLDPPNWAPSKKHLTKALRAYAKLNSLALQALAPGGLLATSTCSHHVSRESLFSVLCAAESKARRRARLLALRGQALDHPVLLSMPETEYLHFALLEVME